MVYLTTVHITKLVPFKFNPNLVNPQVFTSHADQEFEVEEILDIRGERKKNNNFYRTGLEVQVLWKGCYTIISKIYDSRGGELSIKGKKER